MQKLRIAVNLVQKWADSRENTSFRSFQAQIFLRDQLFEVFGRKEEEDCPPSLCKGSSLRSRGDAKVLRFA